MKLAITLTTAAALCASAFVASANQEDRRAAMKEVGKAAKAIRGGTDVAANAQKLIDLSKGVPALFELNEVTGDSAALPAIWTNFDDFTAKAGDLEAAAMAILAAANGNGDMAAAGKALGQSCGGCHKLYKKPDS